MLMLWLQETTAVVAPESASSSTIGTSELLSGALGALFVYLLGAFRRWLQRRRERIALMTLVHLEIMHNEQTMDELAKATGSIRVDDGGLLRQDAWIETRARLTQLVRGRALDYLGTYYTVLATLLDAARLETEADKGLSSTDVEETFRHLHKTWGPLARYVCERYTGYTRVWNKGLLVVGGRWERNEAVERDWYRRTPPRQSAESSVSDNEPDDE